MDDDPHSNTQRGGTIERASRTSNAQQAPASREVAPERYELHDPFAEVTYRMKTLPDIMAKAEELGALRFQAVDAEGRYTQVDKVDGGWRRADGRSLVDPTPSIAEPARTPTNVVPLLAAPPEPEAKPPKVEAKPEVKTEAEAERADHARRLEAALNERYVIKRAALSLGDLPMGQTEYRYRGDTTRVAFTASTFRLATDHNSPSVARSMVDLAEARNWKTLRISGNQDFKRMVWLEASLRGVKTIGYEPLPADHEQLQKERVARQVNRIERSPDGLATAAPTQVAKESVRGGGGRKAVLAALEAVLVAKGVSAIQREAVMTAAAEKLAQRLRNGEIHKVKVYDATAPSQRPVVMPAQEVQRTRERAAPVR
jgi:hypothetical protein